LTAVRERVRAAGRDIWVEVDGGIKVENIGMPRARGADTFVAGSAIFGSKDYKGRSRRCGGARQARLATEHTEHADKNG
jgi:pentose-5-phosphate-3-epimerase